MALTEQAQKRAPIWDPHRRWIWPSIDFDIDFDIYVDIDFDIDVYTGCYVDIDVDPDFDLEFYIDFDIDVDFYFDIDIDICNIYANVGGGGWGCLGGASLQPGP